jgi:D-beta-D-heptose 7-phosphate kinase/D-beta-D-heptose 1-phosphate adenosyltransferase
MTISETLNRLSAYPKIAVVGDIMLDEHVWCEVLGISPEDDLAWKLRHSRRQLQLGGAANVARNLKMLDGDPRLFGAGGEDYAGVKVRNLCEEAGIRLDMTACPDRPTTTKTRYLTAHGRHIMRVDHETTVFLSGQEADQLALRITAAGPFDLIVVSDYAKGVVTSGLMGFLLAMGCPVFVDPKRNFSHYGEATLIKANKEEAERFASPTTDARPVGPARRSGRFIIITDGGNGGRLQRFDGVKLLSEAEVPVRKREVGDPTGCGDSFLAAAALYYSLDEGRNMADACLVGCAAGACTVDHVGVHAVTRDEVLRELAHPEYERAGFR